MSLTLSREICQKILEKEPEEHQYLPTMTTSLFVVFIVPLGLIIWFSMLLTFHTMLNRVYLTKLEKQLKEKEPEFAKKFYEQF